MSSGLFGRNPYFANLESFLPGGHNSEQEAGGGGKQPKRVGAGPRTPYVGEPLSLDPALFMG